VSEKPEASAEVKAPAKSKKMLIIIVVAVLVLVLGGGGAFFYISKQRAAAEEGEDAAPAKAAAHAPVKAPAYLPLESMVVNLADPGGEKVAQVGITLEVLDAHASDTVKAFLPTIRNGVLKQISKRTAAELLSIEGKEKLAKDILREASIPFGGGDEEEEATSTAKKKPTKKAVHVEMPVIGVLFSSFIVQ
jgi:flagellar FliL protein